MTRSILQFALKFGLSILSIVLMTAFLFILRNGLNASTVALLYLIPVLFVTTLGGLWPGVLAAFSAFLAYNYFFIKPYSTFAIHDTRDLVALLIFLILAVFISQLVGRTRTGLADAVARESETIHLYQFSLELAGVNSLDEVASAIARKIAETMQAARLEIALQPIIGNTPFRLSIPPDNQVGGKPELIIPLETVRAFLGEIRIWLEGRQLTSAELRLLQAFAAQGSLALERTALSLNQAQARVLEENDRLKSILLSSVSHEFRTPLATIKAAITGLLANDIPWEAPERTDLLMAVDEEADYLNYLVGNLLDMTRIESGALKPKQQWNVLSEIVEGVAARLHRQLEKFRLAIEIPDDFPLLPVDYLQMEQVFTNLLNNSVKYAPPGSLIQISASVQEPQALIRVVNQGPQLEPDHLERIFDKFFRVTEPERVSGTGLGLSICKGIVEAHGGQIWAENVPGGVSFNFTIPLMLEGKLPPLIEAENV